MHVFPFHLACLEVNYCAWNAIYPVCAVCDPIEVSKVVSFLGLIMRPSLSTGRL